MSSNPTRVLTVASESLPCNAPDNGQSNPGLDCVAVSQASQAEKTLAQQHFDVLVVDLSKHEPGQLALIEYAKQTSPDCRIILVSSDSAHHEVAKAFTLGATDYLQRPFAPEELRRSIARVMTLDSPGQGLTLGAGAALKLNSDSKQASLEGIHALVRAVEAKDPYTQQHSRQVTHYATRLARRLNLQADVIESVWVASLVHDVGKIGVPDYILTKNGPLSEEEFENIRQHPGLGEDIVRNLSLFNAEAKIIRHHHENWDGSGYPDALAREEIPLTSRIIRIADAMDAMLMARSYKGPYPVETMLDELTRCAGRDFDPKVAGIAAEWSRTHTQELTLARPSPKPTRSRSA